MTPKSEEFLRDLGVWGPLENAGRTQPYAAMQVCFTEFSLGCTINLFLYITLHLLLSPCIQADPLRFSFSSGLRDDLPTRNFSSFVHLFTPYFPIHLRRCGLGAATTAATWFGTLPTTPQRAVAPKLVVARNLLSLIWARLWSTPRCNPHSTTACRFGTCTKSILGSVRLSSSMVHSFFRGVGLGSNSSSGHLPYSFSNL